MGFGLTDNAVVELVLKARDEASEVIKHLSGDVGNMEKGIEGFKGFTAGMLGYEAISETIGGVEKLGADLYSLNDSYEQMSMRLQAIYGNAKQSGEAMAWMNQFALQAPFTRQAIMDAGTAIASTGNDISQVLPALGNVAGVMGTDLPTAARAFVDAYEGRFAMMQFDLHITKQQLEQFGMQVDSNGHILNNSFVPAFEKLASIRFHDGMSLQMNTMHGQMSNLIDYFQTFERIAGHSAFLIIEGQVKRLTGFLKEHQTQLAQWGEAIGAALGQVAHWAIQAASVLMSVLPTAINVAVHAWDGISAAARFVWGYVETITAAFVNWFGNTGVPVIKTVLGQVAGWWQDHGGQVQTVLTWISDNVLGFGLGLGNFFTTWFTTLHGIWDVGWGAISGTVSVFLDLITGNWKKLGPDLDKMSTQIAVGIIEIFQGMGAKMIELLTGLRDPINTALHGTYDLTVAVGNMIYDFYDGIAAKIMTMLNGVIGQIKGWANDPTLKAIVTAINPALGAALGLGGLLQKAETPSMDPLIKVLEAKLFHDQNIGHHSAAELDRDKSVLAWVKQLSESGTTLGEYEAMLKKSIAGGGPAGQVAWDKYLLGLVQKVDQNARGQFSQGFAEDVWRGMTMGLSGGLKDGQDITFGKTSAQAIKDLYDQGNKIIADQGWNNPNMGALAADKARNDKLGNGIWQKMLDTLQSLKNDGIKLPGLSDWDKKQLVSLNGKGDNPDLSVNGFGPAEDPRQAAREAKAMLKQLTDQFAADLMDPAITAKQLFDDVAGIHQYEKDHMKVLGTNPEAIRKLYEQEMGRIGAWEHNKYKKDHPAHHAVPHWGQGFYQQERSVFQDDLLHGAKWGKLVSDINHVVGAMARVHPGYSHAAIAVEAKRLTDQAATYWLNQSKEKFRNDLVGYKAGHESMKTMSTDMAQVVFYMKKLGASSEDIRAANIAMTGALNKSASAAEARNHHYRNQHFGLPGHAASFGATVAVFGAGARAQDTQTQMLAQLRNQNAALEKQLHSAEAQVQTLQALLVVSERSASVQERVAQIITKPQPGTPGALAGWRGKGSPIPVRP